MRLISRETIQEIKRKLAQDTIDSSWLEVLREDSRKGVQQLLKSYYRRIARQENLQSEFLQRCRFENELYSNPSIQYIAGVDEVGRGPLAGPVVVACVILPRDLNPFVGINDSKQLSHAQRLNYAGIIKEHAIAYTIIEKDNNIIDKDNIYQATINAMLESINNLSVSPSFVLVDAMPINHEIPSQSIVKGDQLSITIASASILAKVHRDQLMISYAQKYPEYQFERNMGYGTAAHLAALEKYGPTPIHRRSFSPVSNYM